MIKNLNKFKKDLVNFKKCKKCIKFTGINYFSKIQEEKLAMDLHKTKKLEVKITN